jgi:DNA-binding MarR family transcriptional regulator
VHEHRQPDPVDELARQVERASLFNHASLDRVATRASGVESELHELVAAPDAAIHVEPDFAEEFPGADALSAECYVNICHTGDRLLAEVNRRAKASFDLSASAVTVLAIVDGATEPITPGLIAERAIVSSASATSVLDTLEKRGLIVRRPHPDDGRKLVIDLTDAGRAIIDRVLPGIHMLETRVMSALTPADLAQLMRLLSKVQASAATVATEPPEPLDGIRHVPARLGRKAIRGKKLPPTNRAKEVR